MNRRGPKKRSGKRKLETITLRQLREGSVRWLSVAEAAAVVHVTMQSIYDRIEKGTYEGRDFKGLTLVNLKP